MVNKYKKAFFSPFLIGILLGMLFPLIPAAGQETEKIHFEHPGRKEGFLSHFIVDMIQDDQDFIWMSTYNSEIYRYDGLSLKVYKHDPEDPESLPPLVYTRLLQDGNSIWLSSEMGIVRFDMVRERFIQYKHDPSDPTSISGNRVNCLYKDSTGTLWIGTFQSGLNKYNRDTDSFIRYTHDPDNPQSIRSNLVAAVAEDSSGKIWVSTNLGVDYLSPTQKGFTHLTSDPASPDNIGNDFVFSMTTDKNGILWLGTAAGLNSYDASVNKFEHHSLTLPGYDTPLAFSLVYEGPVSGKLWAVAFSGSLYEFDKKNHRFILRSLHDPLDPTSLSATDITTILEDRSGMLWLAGPGAGINKAKLVKKKFQTLAFDPDKPEGFRGTTANHFAEDSSGLIWIASAGGGLQVFDRESGKIVKRYDYPYNSEGPFYTRDVTSLLINREEKIWMITDYGIYRFDPVTEEFSAYPQTLYGVSYLYEDNRGTLWAAGYGLYRYDPMHDVFVPVLGNPDEPSELVSEYIFDIYEDSSGIFWLGTLYNGLIRYDLQKEEFIYLNHSPQGFKPVPYYNIFRVFEDSRGLLWLATKDGLLRYARETGDLTLITEKNGLGSNAIFDIKEDRGGQLWLIAMHGISRYNPDTGIIKNYDPSDGILDGNYNSRAYQCRDGTIFFGGGGVNYFKPSDIKDNHFKPYARITEMLLFNQPVPIGDIEPGRSILSRSILHTEEIELKFYDYVFSFEFAALNFVDAEQSLYAYILEGFESDWNYCGTRNYVTYTNLNPGSYIFKVKASNSDGYWNEEGVSLKIRVLPPFWETWWFRTLIVLSGLGLIIFLYFYTIKRMKAKHKAQLLQREVEIARNIQLALLPDLNLLPETGYQFEGGMLVATAVGGDYYDVIRGMDGRLWMGIGDVSGHGISAGLIMMMAQVAIHNLLSNVSGITPEELLTLANKTITRNIRERMKMNHHMTINFLVEDSPGHFSFAGAHEVILIHRIGTGEVIEVETEGFWLGILDDCSLQMSRGRGNFTLGPGDTLLLYTDGVIETMNKEGEQFDIKRLKDVMRESCDTPETLKAAILENLLNGFKGIQLDDISFLICQRNRDI